MIHSVSDMAGVTIVYVFVLFGLSTGGQADTEIPEFQYPCYVDICTFPTQFCNSERFERRCSPCTRAICREQKVPLACKYICRKYDSPPTTTTTTTPPPNKGVLSSSEESHANGYCSSSFLLLAFSAVTTTIIVVLLVIILVCYVCNKSRAENRGHTLGQHQRSFKSGLVVTGVEQQKLLAEGVSERLLAEPVNTNRGVQPPDNDSPPSYTTSGAQQEDLTISEHECSNRQTCSGYTTNPSPDGDESKHRKPWELEGARPKINNRQMTNSLTQTQQPVSALNLNNISTNDQPLNNAIEMRPQGSSTSEGAHRVPARGHDRDDARGDSTGESDCEETSLKS